VYSADVDLPNGAASTVGRRTFVCKGRRHHISRTLTEQALTAGYQRAVAAGRRRIGLNEL
jgi:hypothetical protein